MKLVRLFTTSMVAIAMAATFGVSKGKAGTDFTLKIGKAIATNFAFLPADVGIASGIFKKHGIDAKIVNFHGSGSLQQGLAADAVDIGLGSGPEIAFVAKGNDDIAVAAIANLPFTSVVLVKKDGPIKSIADLKGRRVSCSSPTSLSNWLGRSLSKQMGWGPNGIKMVPLGGMAAQVAALKTGQTVGMMAETTTAFEAEQHGWGRILVNFGDRFKHFIVHAMFARKAFAKNHPEVLRQFLAAWFETIDYMNAHPKKVIEIEERVAHISKKVASENYHLLMPMMNKVGTFDLKALDLLATSWVELKILPKKPVLNTLYTEKYLPKK